MNSITNWNSNLPGGFDRLNMYLDTYKGNKYDIPILDKEDYIPKDLVSYKEVTHPSKASMEKCIHFFLDDYHFEGVWNSPIKTLARIQKIGKSLTPDFSIYVDMPKALQIFNVYRNRWLGKFWQDNGVIVIPTVSWGDKSTFDFCFEGIQKGNTVAVSTVGVTKKSYDIFEEGFIEMCNRLKPSTVLVQGEKKLMDFENYCDVMYYDTYWKKTRNKLEVN